MKILLIKTSSLGDIIHTLPAVTDAARINSKISFDWVTEESFAEIPTWHKAVNRVVKVSLRRWRRDPLQAIKSGEIRQFWQNLRATNYDYIIDAQGLLLKSGLLTLAARGLRSGLDWRSAREPLASLCYQRKFAVAKNQHAITRNRELLAKVLNYPLPNDLPTYGIDIPELKSQEPISKNLIFIHGSGRAKKCWPEPKWQELAEIATQNEFLVKLPWGNNEEKERAKRIANINPERIEVLPAMSLTALAKLFSQAHAAVAVDTGLGHLAAALNLPTVSLYNCTDPTLIGAQGKNQIHLTNEPSAKTVWQAINDLRKSK